jgi:exopolyphosphatase/pppGpp-phosphohydrolase
MTKDDLSSMAMEKALSTQKVFSKRLRKQHPESIA